ncbi:MAG: hypothetical protein EOO10_09885 [Chitinophagaceae bacterium]|nr:MAG: hypothetical protein EOO10_09885 [Chitinophagaceae bacterium]
MRRLAVVIVLFSSFVAHSQNADSLARSIDSSANQIQQSYESLEDSLYRLKMNRSIHEKGQELDKFLADYEEYKEKEKKRTYIRVGAVVIFAAALTYGVIRKRRQRKKAEN